MKYSELPEEIRKKLEEERNELKNKLVVNSSSEIGIYSKGGTRWFHAKRRVCSSRVGKHDFRFGGRNYWEITYRGMNACVQKTLWVKKNIICMMALVIPAVLTAKVKE